MIWKQKPYFWSFLQNYKYCTMILSKSPSFGHPTELEIFYRDLEAKALLLVIPTELEILP